LIALGAILAFAVHVTGDTHGFDIHTIGVILMIVGAIGLLASFLLDQPYGFKRHATIVERRDEAL